MAATGKNMDFSLRSFAPILERAVPFSGAFDPRGAWAQVYGIYVRTLGPGARIGSLVVRRRLHAPDSTWDLEIAEKRFVAGRRQDLVKGSLRGCRGPWGTPKEIVFSHETRPTPAGLAKPLRSSARITAGDAPGVLHIRRGDRRRMRTLTLSTPWTASWCLFEAVQRLPNQAASGFHLDVLDHWEERKPAQKLEWYGTAAVSFGGERTVHYRLARKLERGVVYAPEVVVEGGETRTLHAWAQTGAGTVPIVYWLDSAGRLVLVLTGLSAFVLEKSRMG